MKIGIVKKIRMTQLFDEKGKQIPVTQVKCISTKVNDLRTEGKHGYRAIQLESDEESSRFRKEFRILTDGEDLDIKKGDKFDIENIKDAGTVSACGFTKGKGFAGSIKRHGFSRGPMSHGSHHKRKTGAIGQCVMPGRVFKGKKMPGRMSSHRITVKNLEIVKQDGKNLYLKGSLPGPKGSYLTLRGI
jgi:large subunit ribosomal protein L3